MKISAKELSWQIQSIINTCRSLHYTGSTVGSTGEQIAAAFVMNKPEYFPANYTDMVEAWDRLGDWQYCVKVVKREYMHLILEAG